MRLADIVRKKGKPNHRLPPYTDTTLQASEVSLAYACYRQIVAPFSDPSYRNAT